MNTNYASVKINLNRDKGSLKLVHVMQRNNVIIKGSPRRVCLFLLDFLLTYEKDFIKDLEVFLDGINKRQIGKEGSKAGESKV